MKEFKPFPELVVDDTHPLSPVIRNKAGEALALTDADTVKRLVDCWNACRKLYSPANHINETEEYVKRLETLRKEAWARVEAQESGAGNDAPSPSLAAREADRSAASLSNGWNHDISQAPRDGSPVILVLNGKPFKSHWNKNKVDPDNWCFMHHKQVPEAWMPWPTYEAHEESSEAEAAA